MSEIIRAYKLQRRDIFKKQGYLFVVLSINEKHIVYRNYYPHDERTMGSCGYMGVFSQERVELVGVRTMKKSTKPFRENYFLKVKKQRA